jgi:alkanesulfonate monooxygenase SsuD/methylene tetrahydromethanopterin reductase-like flavin-dependent oxidoreductase (luciferase family)
MPANRLRNGNSFKLGIFSSNCSGGLAITAVPERWDASWENNAALARMADEAGIEFMLPVARWIGYGGETGFQANAMETVTWAAGLLGVTSGITVFSTMHTAFFHPIVAAKQGATIDRMSGGRWGLNIVCGWNKPEYDMMGLDLPEAKTGRYALAQEWWDVVRRLWTEEAPFDWDGTYFHLKNVHGAPKPAALPPVLNAGSSEDGRDFAARNADFQFTTLNDMKDAAPLAAQTKARAQALGRTVGLFTTCYVVCRPTRKEAEEYHIHYAQECADKGAVEQWMTLSGLYSKRYPQEMIDKARIRFAGGHGCYPLVGTPDDIVAVLEQLSQAGFDGTTIAFVNYLDELPYFRDEVLPRLEAKGLRHAAI